MGAELVFVFDLRGQLPGGKTSGVKEAFTKRGAKYRYGNERFHAWRTDAAAQLFQQRVARRYIKPGIFPLAGWLSLTVFYHPTDCRRRDVPGMLDALCHLLEFAGIVKDDGLIRDMEWLEQLDPKIPTQIVLRVRP